MGGTAALATAFAGATALPLLALAGEAALPGLEGFEGAGLPGLPFALGATSCSRGTRSSCFAAARVMAFPFALAAATLDFLDAIRRPTPAISLDSL